MGRLVKRLSLGALLLVFVLATSAFGQTEILLNGGFESWDNSTSPTGWTKVESITKDSADVHSGTYCAKHVGGTKDLGQYVTVTPGNTYDITLWYKVTAGDGDDARIWSVWRKEGSSDYTYNSDELRGPNNGYLNNNGGVWTKFDTSVVAPEAVDTLYFEVRTYSGATTYWDDLSVIETAAPVEDPADYFIPKGSHAQGYASLKAAVDSINANGVVGEINFVLDADTLREESFTFAAALDADNNVTVKPAEGRDVVLIVIPGDSQGNGAQMIGFNKGFVTFDGSNDGSDSRNLLVTTETNDTRVPFGLNTADADNITIKNLIIRNLDNVTTGFRYGAVTNDVAGIENWVVDNCQIGSVDYPAWRDGIAVWGSSSAPSQGIITNNDIYAAARGIATYVVNDCVFNGNNITMLPTSGAGLYTYNYVHGIYLTGASGPTEIKGNTISCPEAASKASSYLMGIAFAGNSEGEGDPINIENNMIDMGAANETFPTYGIGFRSANNMGNMKIYHNTIVMNETACTEPVYGIGNHSNGTGPVTVDLKNNIFINNHTGNAGSSAIGILPTTSVLTADNNDLVSNQNLVNFKGTSYADLAAWQAAGQGAASISKAVTFASATDLHLASPSDVDVDLAMPMIATVVEDIDGDARGGVEGKWSYAGADEGAMIPSNDIDEDFADASDVTNWSSANSGYTVRTHVDTVLELSDPGWTFDARRPVTAEVNTFFKATARIKTGSFDTSTSQYLNFGVDGLTTEAMKVSCISEEEFTTFTVIGLAENASGTLFIAGSGAGGADTVWVDEYTFDDNYAVGLSSISTIPEARLVADGDLVCTKGVITADTTYGWYGPSYMQDDQAGMAIYTPAVTQNVIVGDEILILGEIDIYNGLVEIKNADYMVLSQNNVVEPVVVNYADIMDAESYEGQLVVMKGVDTLDAGLTWASTEGSNKGMTLVDKNGAEFTCYIDKDTDIDGSAKPTEWPMNITGIVGDYRGAQLLPRSLADFNPNSAPGAFAWITPMDGDTVSSMDDQALVNIEVAPGDSVKALFASWSEAVDSDGDTVTYEMMFIGEGPEEQLLTTETEISIPLDMEKPFEMNGTYTIYLKATDPDGAESLSDTICFTFDFPAPPMVVNADVVLIDGTPQYYVEFDMPITAEIADFKVADWTASTLEAATAVAAISPTAVMVTAPLTEDNVVSLIVDGVTAPAGTLSKADTTDAQTVLIPFSAAHPEDAAMLIEGFEGTLAYFTSIPTYSGSTSGITAASSIAASEEEAFEGSKSGKFTLIDDPEVDGGFFVRQYVKYPYTKTVKANSTILFLVKGTGKVDLALTIKDTGYERMMWKSVSLCGADWQVVSFDLANDEVEGWITGDGAITGETVTICDLHMKSSVDEDVVLYIDGLTERQMLSPVDITLNVNMKEWLRRGDFNLAMDFVDIAGTMNEWGGTSMVLNDFDTDTTYSIVLPLMPYSEHMFKFRINGSWNDATAEFPYGGPSRELTVPNADAEYTYWYNNDTLVYIEPGVEDLPGVFALHQNYPNPFNPTTMIEFDLPEASDVSLVIYDISGRQIRTLVNETGVAAGYRGITWNGRDNMGNNVATGMYIYRLQAGDFVDVKKMTFMK